MPHENPQDAVTSPISTPAPAATGREHQTTLSFDPGATLAGRYRIVSRLGKGGMGEVYRADDLTLGAPVALKFIPPEVAADPVRLDRFRAEVRLTRQISNANVARVYDINETTDPASGAPRVFLSMEYIDGEDLASLLRRIGRLPTEKAVEIARQLCFGLAAAHEQGVVHRDLKPANIMIDGRGRARIMDFGIAAGAGQAGVGLSGTPAYMSPEQAAGEPPTVRSDLFSLGLVLYELFTCKPAVTAASLAEAREFHRSHDPANPSTLVADLDPAVERTIMRCLDRDPAKRPASAIVVLSSLPGGDPLAAALAAGETPSPELVAASGRSAGLRPRIAVALLISFVILLLGAHALRANISLLSFTPLEFSSDVLTAKARGYLKDWGFPDSSKHRASAFYARTAYLRHFADAAGGAANWSALADAPMSPIAFWFRQSPDALTPRQWWQRRVWQDEPPPTDAGETLIILDRRATLAYFSAITPDAGHAILTAADRAPPDWAALFTAANLSLASFTPAHADSPATWSPGVPSDSRFTWTGPMPGEPGAILEVHAATDHNRLVFFHLLTPWAREAITAPPTPASAAARALEIAGEIIQTGMMIAASILTWRHIHASRGDRRGAARLAAFVFFTQLITEILSASDPFVLIASPSLMHAIVRSIFLACSWWLLYLALEPFVRRYWSHALISWSRLLEGRIRDPLVGRDILIGGAVASFALLANPLVILYNRATGDHTSIPLTSGMEALSGGRFALALVANSLANSLALALIITFGLVIIRIILRRDWATAPVMAIIFTILMMDKQISFPDLAASIIGAVIMTALLMRFGVLAFATTFFLLNALTSLPASTDLTTWYAGPTILGVLLAITLAALAARTAIGTPPRTT